MTLKEAFYNAKSWQEKVAYLSLYHNLRLSKNKKWRVRDTAEYFCVSMGYCSEELKLSERFDEIRECDSRNKALGILNERNLETSSD